jgi:pyruvate/2-oxoacid:ferredoxin oxidoreductase beta subunit
MSVGLSKGIPPAFRAIVAAGCITAIFLALVLSALPQLHEQIHNSSATTTHECAVTLLTSGNYQHTPNTAISLAPPAPPTAFAHALANSQLVRVRLEFSLLEHAPPAIS